MHALLNVAFLLLDFAILPTARRNCFHATAETAFFDRLAKTR